MTEPVTPMGDDRSMRPPQTIAYVEGQLTALADEGIFVTVGFGPTARGTLFMVMATRIVDGTYQAFDQPIVAPGLAEAVDDAVCECVSRGWLTGPTWSARPTAARLGRALVAASGVRRR